MTTNEFLKMKNLRDEGISFRNIGTVGGTIPFVVSQIIGSSPVYI